MTLSTSFAIFAMFAHFFQETASSSVMKSGKTQRVCMTMYQASRFHLAITSKFFADRIYLAIELYGPCEPRYFGEDGNPHTEGVRDPRDGKLGQKPVKKRSKNPTSLEFEVCGPKNCVFQTFGFYNPCCFQDNNWNWWSRHMFDKSKEGCKLWAISPCCNKGPWMANNRKNKATAKREQPRFLQKPARWRAETNLKPVF